VAEKKLANAPEPRWPAGLAIFAAGIVYAAIPSSLAVGPWWVPVVVVTALELPTIMAHQKKWYRANHALGVAVSGILTLLLLWSLGLLIAALPAHREEPVDLLRSAGALWVANIIVFAVWYWRLDAGGPLVRDKAPGHTEGAFLFPQMMYPPPRGTWSPRFVDYLFLAFNNSTAFSPTDVPVLSRWAKILTMLQSMISLAIVIMLVARGINML
jgi:hypothetical protein